MWRNYLTVGIRALAKNKTYAFINIFGLAIGMAACLMILLYVRYEMSYDKWIPEADRVYQIQSWYKSSETGEETQLQMTPYASGKALQKDFPQVESQVYLFNNNPVFLKDGEAISSEELRKVAAMEAVITAGMPLAESMVRIEHGIWSKRSEADVHGGVGAVCGSAVGVSGRAAGLAVIVLNAITTLGSFQAFLLSVVLAGLILLWHRRQGDGSDARSWRGVLGWALLGWGVFNIIEGVISHHLLEIHHVRPGPNQLAYDLGFLAFGAILVAIGWAMIQSARSDVPARTR